MQHLGKHGTVTKVNISASITFGMKKSMEQLYAPWRSSYITSTARSKNEGAASDECVFCTVIAQTCDETNSVLKRYKHTFVLLSRYPYNAGHLLVLPYEHIGNLEELPDAVSRELMQVTVASVGILKKALHAQGVNLGMNLGKVAGAGIPAHLHMHALPRWHGDTGFLPLIGEVKAVSCDLNDVYRQLKPHFDLYSPDA